MNNNTDKVGGHAQLIAIVQRASEGGLNVTHQLFLLPLLVRRQWDSSAMAHLKLILVVKARRGLPSNEHG